MHSNVKSPNFGEPRPNDIYSHFSFDFDTAFVGYAEGEILRLGGKHLFDLLTKFFGQVKFHF